MVASRHPLERDRCADVFVRPDGTIGFEEFRGDPEDIGAWMPVSSYAGGVHATTGAALIAARAVPWLAVVLDR